MGYWGSFKENLISILQDYEFKFAPNYDQILYFSKKRTTGTKNITSFLAWNFNDEFENSQIMPLLKQILHAGQKENSFMGYLLTINENFIETSLISYEFSTRNIEIIRINQKPTPKKGGKKKKKTVEILNQLIFPKLTEFFNLYLAKFSNYEFQQFLLSSVLFSYCYTHPDFEYSAAEIDYVLGKNSIFYFTGIKLMEKKYQEKSKTLKKYYNRWKDIYSSIYDPRVLNLKLFILHSYYSLLVKAILYLNRFSPADEEKNFSKTSFYQFSEIIFMRSDSVFEDDIFGWGLDVDQMVQIFDNFLRGIKVSKTDIFAEIYQKISSVSNRQASGEFYTPKALILLMIDAKFNDQKTILDPACGSGGFLIEIMKKHLGKKNHVNRRSKKITLLGIDANPLAIQTAYTNSILFLLNHTEGNLNGANKVEFCFFQDNALFPRKSTVDAIKKVDFIIGNPPWINISGIYSEDYKTKLKNLAKELKILFGVEAKNTEISSIFFYRCRDLYLKNKGIIFFVLPATVLNGNQHVLFRYFYKFEEIEAWGFNGDIFKIYSICLCARKMKFLEENLEETQSRLRIDYSFYNFKNNGGLQFSIKERTKMVPAFIKSNNNGFPLIGSYNPIDLSDSIINSIVPERSSYYKLVKGGIRIVPRRWVVIKERPPFPKIVEIHPDFTQQAKEKWSEPPYSKRIIESEYIHPFLKSQGLIPFSFVKLEFAFIPFDISDFAVKNRQFFNEEKLKPKAKSFYRFIDLEYRKLIKSSASMKTLSDNFTYNRRLVPSVVLFRKGRRDVKKFMVVHNSIGSIVKSVVLKESVLLDNSLYYFLTDNENEAYYICGVLNSPLMTALVKRIGSTGSRGSLRNIHKNPYNFPIRKYTDSDLQRKISSQSKKIEQYVQEFISKLIGIKKNFENTISFLLSFEDRLKARSVQRSLFSDVTYRNLIDKMDSDCKTMFLS